MLCGLFFFCLFVFLYFVIFFNGMLNVRLLLFFFVCLLSYSRELAHELSTCVYVHHCA